MRASEQVRLDLCYHSTNVKVFGTFAGLQSSFSGPSHHAIEDLAIARSLPNMTVLAPADGVAVYHATMAAIEHEGPVYVRLAMDETPGVYGEDCRFAVGGANVLREGDDLTLVAAGLTTVPNALAAAGRLAEVGIEARVVDLYSIKPIDRDVLVESARRTGLVVTVEEHSVLGGVGGAVAEVLAEEYPVPMKILGVPDVFCEDLGTHEEHLARFGLDPEGIAGAAQGAFENLRKGA
jgi:transketolase